MTQSRTTRLLGRIERIYRDQSGQQNGFLVTANWDEYRWNASSVKDAAKLYTGDVVDFIPVPPNSGENYHRASDVKIVHRKMSAQKFKQFSEYLDRRAEEEVA